jgi:copper chaperone
MMARTTLNVPDISCEHCEHTIVNALQPQNGIKDVSVDIPAHEVHVTFDEQSISIEKMKEILEEEEYPVASAH